MSKTKATRKAAIVTHEKKAGLFRRYALGITIDKFKADYEYKRIVSAFFPVQSTGLLFVFNQGPDYLGELNIILRIPIAIFLITGIFTSFIVLGQLLALPKTLLDFSILAARRHFDKFSLRYNLINVGSFGVMLAYLFHTNFKVGEVDLKTSEPYLIALVGLVVLVGLVLWSKIVMFLSGEKEESTTPYSYTINRCSNCDKVVSPYSAAGEHCPNCGLFWSK